MVPAGSYYSIFLFRILLNFWILCHDGLGYNCICYNYVLFKQLSGIYIESKINDDVYLILGILITSSDRI